MNGAHFMTITSHTFDTRQFDPKRHSELLRDHLGKMLLRMNLTPLHQDNWSARGVSRLLPGITVTDCAAGPIRLSRHAEHLADQSGDLMLAFVSSPFRLSGPGRADRDGRHGDICFFTLDEAMSVTLGSAYSARIVQVKRDLVAPYVRRLDLGHRPLDGSGAAARLLQTYLATLAGSATQPAPLAATAAAHIRDLAALLLGAAPDATDAIRAGGVRAARLAAVRAHIAAHFRDPALTAAETARALGITPRYVRRLLEEDGESYADLVAEHRLDAAHRLLTAPATTGATIAEIAESVGYVEFTTFFRQFRRRFGMAPSDARRGGAASEQTATPPG